VPLYSFYNKKTKKSFEELMKIAEMEQYLKDNPHIVQEITKAPAIGDAFRLGVRRPDEGFKDRLREIKSKFPRSTINV
jgi:hypothetical protein